MKQIIPAETPAMPEENEQKESRFSLHGMTPEEAIQKMFGAGQQEITIYCDHCKESITGPTLVGEEGETRCPKCGTIATREQP